MKQHPQAKHVHLKLLSQPQKTKKNNQLIMPFLKKSPTPKMLGWTDRTPFFGTSPSVPFADTRYATSPLPLARRNALGRVPFPGSPKANGENPSSWKGDPGGILGVSGGENWYHPYGSHANLPPLDWKKYLLRFGVLGYIWEGPNIFSGGGLDV